MEFFSNLFNTSDFPPRWICGEWTGFHGWLYITSNLLIWASYFGIPLGMFYIINYRKDLPYTKIFWYFLFFILLCGLSHLNDAIIFWFPFYRFNAVVLALTAIISWITLLSFIKAIPSIIELKSPAQLQKAIDEKTEELNERNSQLEVQNNLLSDFTNITSHDLRSPAANLEGLIALYDEADDEQERQLLFEKVRSVSGKLSNAIDNLALLTKTPIGETINAETFCIRDEMKDVVDQLQLNIEEANAQISINVKDGLVISYPRTYFDSLVFNLLSNSIKYRHNKNRLKVELGAYEKGGSLFLYCQDNGIGIDMKKHGENLFDLHYTVEKRPDSTGFGLYFTKKQIQSQGGDINVESSPGEGARFIARLT